MTQPQYNIIIDPLPSSINIGGRDVPISTTFRTGMLFDILMNSDADDNEKAISSISLWFPDGLPDLEQQTIEDAVEGITWFYLCGKNANSQQEAERKPHGKPGGITRRTYDFDVDAPMIYAAFLAQYAIDLQDVQDDLHWWKFCALFRGLTEEHEISKIMGYRSVDLSTIKNRQERERLAKLQATYALPDNRSAEEKARAIGSVFGGIR